MPEPAVRGDQLLGVARTKVILNSPNLFLTVCDTAQYMRVDLRRLFVNSRIEGTWGIYVPRINYLGASQQVSLGTGFMKLTTSKGYSTQRFPRFSHLNAIVFFYILELIQDTRPDFPR